MSHPSQPDQPAQVDRRTGLGRRASFVERGSEALKATPENSGAEAPNQEGTDAEATGLERRRGPGRRRTDYTKSAEEGEMTSEQFLFVRAIDTFKVANNKMYPSWTDVLEVVRLLGYRKTTTSELKIRGAEDFTEKPDAPTGVRAKAGHPEATHGITRERRAA